MLYHTYVQYDISNVCININLSLLITIGFYIVYKIYNICSINNNDIHILLNIVYVIFKCYNRLCYSLCNL